MLAVCVSDEQACCVLLHCLYRERARGRPLQGCQTPATSLL